MDERIVNLTALKETRDGNSAPDERNLCDESLSKAEHPPSLKIVPNSHNAFGLNEAQRRLRLSRCYCLLSAVARRRDESRRNNGVVEATQSVQRDGFILDNATQE